MIDEVEDYAIILLDKNGIVQNWNKGAEKIKGYKEEEIVGKSFSNFYLPEDHEAELPEKILSEAKQKGKAVYEGWRVRKDGSRFWGSIVLTALHDHENNIIGFSKVTRDLTQSKLAEDKMQEYTKQLEFKNKELEQFSYAASHDMKEPLRKILFYISSTAEKLKGQIDEKAADYLQRSIGAAKRMKDLIEDLLTYARTNGDEEIFEPVDLNEIIDDIVLLHKDEFEQKAVSIETDKLQTIAGIPFQMNQLFENLITNSVKYRHPERSCTIRIKGETISAFQLSANEINKYKQYYHISVSDNGMGFDPEFSEKIFEIFQRLHNAPDTKGSGIGLAICKRIVENHRGFITATGRKNEWARFDIYFPLGIN
jgi:PAS domain S-box-containing protein